MNIIKQNAKLLTNTGISLWMMEYAARTCTATTHLMFKNLDFLKESIIKRKHYSILEHASFTFELTTTRAIANQIVRHRMAAYAQESMRYVKLNRKDGGIPFIEPYSFDSWDVASQGIWRQNMICSEEDYEMLLFHGVKAEEARGVLPLDTATVLVATWNLRELFHILYHPVSGRLTNKHAQPQTRELFALVEQELKDKCPEVYELAEAYKETENIKA
jgi:thymidylate synthase (FAD)